MRRPLCVLCGVFLCVQLVLQLFFSKDSWQSPYREKEEVTLSGRIERIETKKGKNVLILRNLRSLEEEEFEFTNEKAVCYLDGTTMAHVGSYILIRGKYASFHKPRNPGEFDYSAYQRRKGIFFSLNGCQVLGSSKEYSYLQDGLYRIRKKADKIFDTFLCEEDAGILKTMLLGDKESLQEEDKNVFQEGGISHILAISGLHISLIGMGLFKLLTFLTRPIELWHVRRKGELSSRLYAVKAVFCILAMASYGWMTGMSTSSFRAIFMFALMLEAGRIGRTYDTLTALSLAGVLILLENPLYVFDAGYVLSFGAVLALALFLPIVKMTLAPYAKNKLLDVFLASLTVMLFSLPVLMLNYYEIHPWSLLINIVVVPSVGVLVLLGILLLFLGCFALYPASNLLSDLLAMLCKPIGSIGHLMLYGYRQISSFFGKAPLGSLVTGKPPIWKVIVYYLLLIGLLFFFYVRKKGSLRRERCKITAKSRAFMGLVLTAGVLMLIIPGRPFRITMLDVGQGDGLCVEKGSHCFMVDGGSSSQSQLGKYTILPFLRAMGRREVNLWFVSHPDMDHLSGLIDILSDYEDSGIVIGQIVLPAAADINKEAEELIRLAGQQNVAVNYLSRGDVLRLEGIELLCLHPRKGYVTEDANRESEVLLLRWKKGNFSMLFTGDADQASERELMEYAGMEGVDLSNLSVLKAGHHGSQTATSMELLTKTRPELTLISAGIDNRYGHPHDETIERLNKCGIPYLSTQSLGAITLYPQRNTFRIEGYVH